MRHATRDGLTGLPNHRALEDELPKAIARATRHEQPLVLVVMDVDDLTFTNDTHGRDQGDAMLRRIAGVLEDGRADDRVYRTGGDEFAAIFPNADSHGALVIAGRLHRLMSEAGIQMSIGVSTRSAGQTAESLRATADAALSDAKRRGGDQFTHYDDIRELVPVTSLDKPASAAA